MYRTAVNDIIEGFKLSELWGRLCWNEIKRRYRRTMFGPMWVTVSLSVFSIAMSLVWSILWHQNVREYLPYLLSGLIPWMVIASCLGESCGAFLGGEANMKSRLFPYSMLIYVVVSRNVILFGHNMIAYVLAAILCGVPLTAYTLLAIPGFALLVINVAWMSLLCAIVCLRFRDVQQLVTMLLQLVMLITPVFWPVSQLGTGRARLIVDLNLIYHMIDVVRTPLLGKPPALEGYVVCVLFAIFGWLFVFWLYAKKRHRLVYWF